MQEELYNLFPKSGEIPEQFRIPAGIDGASYLIDGSIHHHPGPARPVFSPVMIRQDAGLKAPPVGTLPLLSGHTALEALDAAERAFDCGMGLWPQMDVEERLERMEAFLGRMSRHEKAFALMEMWELGKKYSECLVEFRRTEQYIRNTIEAYRILDKDSSYIERVGPVLAQIKRCPLGIVLCMGPFNYPLNETFALVIPALSMGNAVILKLPEPGSLCTLPLMEDFAALFPPGTINIINGDGEEIIGPIMKSGKVAVLGFIGSTRVANLLINQHPGNNRLRTILGLEAKNSAFIMPDADLETTLSECISGTLEFNGQRCTSLKHIWVHEKLADRFLAGLAEKIEQAGIGMPWRDDIMVTPLAEANKTEYLGELVEDACRQGARVINPRGGSYTASLFYPAILYPVTEGMQVYREEQFGPVIPVSTFSSLEDLYPYFRQSSYGQQASLFATSSAQAAPLLDILVNQVSRVNLNIRCQRGPDELPFTGRKDSAEGTLSISDALRAFSIRSLAVANEAGRDLFFQIIASGRSQFLRL